MDMMSGTGSSGNNSGSGTSKTSLISAFGLGYAAGFASAKYWPAIKEKMGPLGKELLAKGLNALDNAKDMFWEKSEKFADVIAEIKEGQEAANKKGNKK